MGHGADVTGLSLLPVLLTALLAGLLLGLTVGAVTGAMWSRGRGPRQVPGADPAGLRHAEARAAEAAVMRESLDRLHDQLRDMAQHGVSWQSQLKQQVDEVRHSTDTLRRETASLSTALRRPQVRGRWGELHLRRVVELAGLVDRCDFTEQVSATVDVAGAGGTTTEGERLLRPDLVVHLAGDKHVIVDAKVPLDAFLDACAEDPGRSEEHRSADLRRHARQLRHHVDVLAGKTYWRALPAMPEFVVLFVPGESFLSAALEAEPSLLEYAADRRVVLATPTTLIALLRTVAYAWTQETLTAKAQEIHELGRDLYERLGTMGAHLDRLGRSLTGAVGAYNRAVGSLETRVLVSARRFEELGVARDHLDGPHPVVEAPRLLTAAELMDSVADHRADLPDQDDSTRPAVPPVRRVAP
jgi:DNA recombination protein RmuC